MNPWILVVFGILLGIMVYGAADSLGNAWRERTAMNDDGIEDVPLFELEDDDKTGVCPNCGELLEDPDDDLCMACADE